MPKFQHCFKTVWSDVVKPIYNDVLSNSMHPFKIMNAYKVPGLYLISLLFCFPEPLPGIPGVIKERLLSLFSLEKEEAR